LRQSRPALNYALNYALGGGAAMADIPGLHLVTDYLDEARELALIEVIDREPWLTELRRRVQHYGYKYDYKGRKVTPEMYLGPLPEWLQPLCQELKDRGLMPRVADQVIVNEYEPGQGIAPHVDCVPCFDDTIASLTLGGSCSLELTRVKTREKAPLFLARRSLVVLAGEARYDWRHAIPARKSDLHEGRSVARDRRLSLTFRNVLVEK
jgi:alkylated DNA repair dioxygenase AlkB